MLSECFGLTYFLALAEENPSMRTVFLKIISAIISVYLIKSEGKMHNCATVFFKANYFFPSAIT